MSNKIKSLINENLTRSIKLSLKKIFSKLNIYKPKRIHHNKKPYERRKIYSKDDLMVVILSQGNTKSRSRSNSISYDLCSTSNIITPDKKTWRPVKNINIKVNVFWGEEYRKEQIDLTIPRTSFYSSFKKTISEKLGYGISSDFAILYHTKKYDPNNTMRRILLDYWIKNKMLWFVDNDFKFRKHLLLWKDYIEITAVRKSII
jgi:hypothetical protein